MSNKPKVEVLSIEQGATPDLLNFNKHTQRGRGLHENSMRKRGVGRSIFSAGKGVDVPVVIGGNQTLEIAAQMGLEIINVHTSGNQIVNVVRDDIEPGSVVYPDNSMGYRPKGVVRMPVPCLEFPFAGGFQPAEMWLITDLLK